MIEHFHEGVLYRRWDDAIREVVTFNPDGTVQSSIPYTVEESEAADLRALEQTQATNDSTIRQQAEAALSNNRTFINLASPSNAQNVAQLKALTRQMNGVIRLILNKLDGTD